MTTETEARAEFIAWARAQAIPLSTTDPTEPIDDLVPLAASIGDAQLVSLGEATHGTSEFFLLKHRLVRFLNTLPGFSTFLMEAAYDESHLVDAWLQTGAGDSGAVLEGLHFWTWNTEEVHSLLIWLRKHQWRFAGFDPQFCPSSPTYLGEMTGIGNYARERGAAMAAQDDIWAVRRIRDEAMARIAVLQLERAGRGARAVVWAHNQHVGRDGFAGRFTSMGGHLDQLLGRRQVIVGFLFGQGRFRARDAADRLVDHWVPLLPNSVEAALDEVGEPLFALDLRTLPKNSGAASWLKSRPVRRGIGAEFIRDGGSRTDLAQQYDLIIYVARTEAARGRLTGPGSDSARRQAAAR